MSGCASGVGAPRGALCLVADRGTTSTDEIRATIGIVTAILSALGVVAGHRFGVLLGPRLEVAGGLLLVGLGVKILVEHLAT